MSDQAARELYFRLSLALALSVALHLSLIYGIAPRPGLAARPIPPLFARLIADVATTRVESGKHVAPAPPTTAPTPHRSLVAPVSLPEIPLVAAPPSNGDDPVQRREESTLPKADLPFPADLQWYEARDLDGYPHALEALESIYPASAQTDAAHGVVTLLLWVDETGSVHDATVVNAEPTGYFEAAALTSVRSARFAPGEKDGRAVRSKIVVKLHFAPQD